MSAVPDLALVFRDMEKRLEAEPEGVTGEIVRGVYAMSPRPRMRHAQVALRLGSILDGTFGEDVGEGSPEWLFLVEPEIRSERAFSRLVPDLAGWRRSSSGSENTHSGSESTRSGSESTRSGWPGLDDSPTEVVPDWVAEVLSPTTERADRVEKLPAYGAMGVGWAWLVDPVARIVETFSNQKGRMVAGPSFGEAERPLVEPFNRPIPLDRLFRTLALWAPGGKG